ncbi:unnamed protein product [Rhodiola kirilowii]
MCLDDQSIKEEPKKTCKADCSNLLATTCYLSLNLLPLLSSPLLSSLSDIIIFIFFFFCLSSSLRYIHLLSDWLSASATCSTPYLSLPRSTTKP